ncbi:MAG: NUDIX domain-containing protein [Leptolyngbyaceae cyanobacterium CRU_2_3]|nr:NUDIX domain-containing protein [Leptolyngbyaceae cyanobacterium CRU_2_3]
MPPADSHAAVAIAILYQDNCFLMQLREEKPEIAYPGCWAFFGGHIEPEEAPAVAMQRELLEEIGYAPPTLTLFTTAQDANFTRYVFHAPLTVGLDTLELNEGCDLGLVTIEEIQQGSRYSTRMERTYPLGEPHQKILLNFIRQELSLSAVHLSEPQT